MAETSSIYPKIPLSDSEIETLKTRREIIKSKVKEFEEKINHYEKLVKKYSKVKSSLIITGVALGSLIGLSTLVLGVIPFVIPVIPIALSVGGVISGSIPEIAALSFIRKKKQQFTLRLNMHEKYLNQLHHLYEKVNNDGLITLDEMGEFFKLIDKYETELKGVKEETVKSEEFDLTQLRKEAMQQAKNEYVIEARARLKEEALVRLRSAAAT